MKNHYILLDHVSNFWSCNLKLWINFSLSFHFFSAAAQDDTHSHEPCDWQGEKENCAMCAARQEIVQVKQTNFQISVENNDDDDDDYYGYNSNNSNDNENENENWFYMYVAHFSKDTRHCPLVKGQMKKL